MAIRYGILEDDQWKMHSHYENLCSFQFAVGRHPFRAAMARSIYCARTTCSNAPRGPRPAALRADLSLRAVFIRVFKQGARCHNQHIKLHQGAISLRWTNNTPTDAGALCAASLDLPVWIIAGGRFFDSAVACAAAVGCVPSGPIPGCPRSYPSTSTVISRPVP